MATHADRPSTPPGRAILHDSPFSDYYSDSAFSAGSQRATKIQSALLNRLSQLAVQVTREEPIEPVAHHVQRALDNLYALFAVPDTQTRQPADLEDSGLFVEDDRSIPGTPCKRLSAGLSEDVITDEELEDVYSTMIKMSVELREGFLEMKDHQSGLMADMTKVQNQNDALKAENKSLRSQNDILQAQVTALRAKIESLRTQNHSLRTDLQSDFTELMSLKLQLMAIEVKSALHLGQDSSNILKQSMERWTVEWHEMDEKFRERREKFSGSVDPNLLGEAHQLAADISAFLNLEDGNLKPKSSRHSRNVPGAHVRGSSDPFPTVLASTLPPIEEMSAEQAEESTQKSQRSTQDASTDHSPEVKAEEEAKQAPSNTEEQKPTPTQSRLSFLLSFWRSGPKQFSVSKSLLEDPRKSIWDALSEVAGVDMYDDFNDEASSTD
ncbi:hypothetical protein MPH_00892 [Macrophomina phaseolina MS6]|uniref:Uncharacterized protein n=1 Tax=Macrophomina phaseolina (strain MS6) TaxID=1126212 RepID=K2SH24_MACPH|nr:hypothetical protein MPH_00892 [Macrophomina phaseolina MS6]